MNRELEAWSAGLLRGGPLLRTEAAYQLLGGDSAATPASRSESTSAPGATCAPRAIPWSAGVAPTLSVRPSGRATFSLGARLSRNLDDRQWVRRIDTGAPNYLFARHRTDHRGADRPHGLRLHGRPLAAGVTPSPSWPPAATARSSAWPTRARSDTPTASRAVEALPEGGRYRAELNGSPVSFGNPDFSFKQFRSNAVLRWEYSPGSVLYLVWSQGRNHAAGTGRFDFGSDLGDLFGAAPDNVFMVKLSYWLSR